MSYMYTLLAVVAALCDVLFLRSIMCVSFVARTHMFFTGGKDRLLKEWDGDSFQHIQTLKVSPFYCCRYHYIALHCIAMIEVHLYCQ